jgi:hypothetical protein
MQTALFDREKQVLDLSASRNRSAPTSRVRVRRSLRSGA